MIWYLCIFRFSTAATKEPFHRFSTPWCNASLSKTSRYIYSRYGTYDMLLFASFSGECVLPSGLFTHERQQPVTSTNTVWVNKTPRPNDRSCLFLTHNLYLLLLRNRECVSSYRVSYHFQVQYSYYCAQVTDCRANKRCPELLYYCCHLLLQQVPT